MGVYCVHALCREMMDEGKPEDCPWQILFQGQVFALIFLINCSSPSDEALFQRHIRLSLKDGFLLDHIGLDDLEDIKYQMSRTGVTLASLYMSFYLSPSSIFVPHAKGWFPFLLFDPGFAFNDVLVILPCDSALIFSDTDCQLPDSIQSRNDCSADRKSYETGNHIRLVPFDDFLSNSTWT